MSLVDSIAQAIASMEAGTKPNPLSVRNNNPGNLRSWGSNPVVNGYAKFPTMEDGWAALKAQIQKNIDRGLTMQEFFAGKPGVYSGFAPSADNNAPLSYADYVAQHAGIDPTVPLNQLGSSPPPPNPRTAPKPRTPGA